MYVLEKITHQKSATLRSPWRSPLYSFHIFIFPQVVKSVILIFRKCALHAKFCSERPADHARGAAVAPDAASVALPRRRGPRACPPRGGGRPRGRAREPQHAVAARRRAVPPSESRTTAHSFVRDEIVAPAVLRQGKGGSDHATGSAHAAARLRGRTRATRARRRRKSPWYLSRRFLPR